MRRYQTDRHGLISSFDIAEALRRAEQRRLARERQQQERAARVAASPGWLARVRELLVAPRRSAA
jgi:hypothetical protein